MLLTEKICVFCGVFYNLFDIATISILTIELPTILNPDCDNVTDVSGTDTTNSCDISSWRKPGLVLAMPNFPALLFGSLIGYLTSKYNARALYGAALLFHAAGSCILAWNATSFWCLIAGTLIGGVGNSIGGVTVPAMLKSIVTSDTSRCRLMNLCALARVLGYSNGYYIGTMAYEHLGFRATFGFLAVLWVVLSSVMFLVYCLNRKDQIELSDEEQCLVESRTNVHGCYVLQNPYLLLLLYQTFFIQFPITGVLATAPSQLQLKIGFSAELNGMITGLALMISFFVILSLLVLIRSNFVHVLSIVILLVPETIGMSVYPSVYNFGLALLCETGIQCSRVCLNSLHGSFLMLLSDRQNLDYPMVNALYITMRYGSNCLGSFTAPFIVDWLGFTTTYYVMVSLLAPVFLSNFIYFKVIRSARCIELRE